MSTTPLRYSGNLLPTYLKYAILFLFPLLLFSCSGEVYNSLWQSSAVKADGIPTEWSKPLKHYDPSTKLQYTFSNDRKNMYICIRATDDMTQKKILQGGMVIWIDTTGKGKERTGLTYPIPDINTKSESEMGENRNRNQGDEPSSYRPKRKFHNNHIEMLLTGFKPPIGGLVPLSNLDGIAVNLHVDSLDILTYEAIIPFRTFYRDSLITSDSSRVMTFKIVVNGMPHAKKGSDDSEAASNMSSQSMAGGMGGRGSSKGGGRGQAPIDPLYESHSVKSQIKLRIKAK
jgi:hypothetical protein